mgnify:CR=1 FL=1
MISSVFGKTKPINYILVLSFLFVIFWGLLFTRFREEAARAAEGNKPFPPPAARRSFQAPLEILSEQPVRIPVGGTVEVQVRLGWNRNGQIQVDLSDPPEGTTVDSASWTKPGLALVLRGEHVEAEPADADGDGTPDYLEPSIADADGDGFNDQEDPDRKSVV